MASARSLLTFAILLSALLAFGTVYMTFTLDYRMAAPHTAEPTEEQQISGTTPQQIGGTVSGSAPGIDERVPPPPPKALEVLQSVARVSTTTLQCPAYAGPMFFPYYPGAKKVPRHAVQSAALPGPLEEQPRARPDPARVPLQPFALQDVRLEPSSRFGIAQRTNAAFLRKLDPDRLLYFFRRLAGLPQPRADITPYGGWESQGSGLRGEFAGHYLHAAAAAAAATSDAFLRDRCEKVVVALEDCQQALGPDGYVSAFPTSEFQNVEDFTCAPPRKLPRDATHRGAQAGA